MGELYLYLLDYVFDAQGMLGSPDARVLIYAGLMLINDSDVHVSW